MPSAPTRIVLVTARFMARRNITRRSSCCAMPSATSWASSSGLRTSEMLMRTSWMGMRIICATSSLSFSISSPFLPMTIPGRAVWIVMLAFFAGRSILILLTEASLSFLLDEFTHLVIHPDVLREVLRIGIPLGRPVFNDAQPDTCRMYFLTHAFSLCPVRHVAPCRERHRYSSPTRIVMWLLRLIMRVPRPLARAR